MATALVCYMVKTGEMVVEELSRSLCFSGAPEGESVSTAGQRQTWSQAPTLEGQLPILEKHEYAKDRDVHRVVRPLDRSRLFNGKPSTLSVAGRGQRHTLANHDSHRIPSDPDLDPTIWQRSFKDRLQGIEFGVHMHPMSFGIGRWRRRFKAHWSTILGCGSRNLTGVWSKGVGPLFRNRLSLSPHRGSCW